MLDDASIIRETVYPMRERILNRIRRLCAGKGRDRRNCYIRETLGDIPFTIFSNNCIGGVFYHDAGRRFTSPTVNLAMDGEEFIRFLEDPRKYVYGNMMFVDTDQVNYPVAMLEDIEVRFVHYRTPEECEQTWRRRAERIDWENLYIIATDHDGLKREDLLERFDKLPYENKIMFTSDEYEQYPWAVCVPQFRGRFQVKIMTAFADFRGTRIYETCSDPAKWIADAYYRKNRDR